MSSVYPFMLRIPAFFRPPFAGSRTSFPEVQIPHPDKKTTLPESRVVFYLVGTRGLSATLLRNACSTGAHMLRIPAFFRPPFAGSRTSFQEVQIPHPDKKTTLLESKVVFYLVGTRGFEPPTSCTPCKRSTRLNYVPNVLLQ